MTRSHRIPVLTNTAQPYTQYTER